jgi:hypothetical protein
MPVEVQPIDVKVVEAEINCNHFIRDKDKGVESSHRRRQLENKNHQ